MQFGPISNEIVRLQAMISLLIATALKLDSRSTDDGYNHPFIRAAIPRVGEIHDFRALVDSRKLIN